MKKTLIVTLCALTLATGLIAETKKVDPNKIVITKKKAEPTKLINPPINKAVIKNERQPIPDGLSWIDLNSRAGESIHFSDKKLKMNWTPETFIEAWEDAKSRNRQAALRALGFGGQMFTQNNQLLVVWTRVDMDIMPYLVVENFGTESVTVEFLVEYLSERDRNYNNKIYVPAGLIMAGEVAACPVTAMGFDTKEFNLYLIDWDDSGTGDPSKELLGTFSWAN